MERNRNFEIVWSSYPRKDAKEAARKAWHKLATDDFLSGMDVILKAITAQRNRKAGIVITADISPFVTWFKNMRFADPEVIEDVAHELRQLQ